MLPQKKKAKEKTSTIIFSSTSHIDYCSSPPKCHTLRPANGPEPRAQKCSTSHPHDPRSFLNLKAAKRDTSSKTEGVRGWGGVGGGGERGGGDVLTTIHKIRRILYIQDPSLNVRSRSSRARPDHGSTVLQQQRLFSLHFSTEKNRPLLHTQTFDKSRSIKPRVITGACLTYEQTCLASLFHNAKNKNKKSGPRSVTCKSSNSHVFFRLKSTK